MTIGKTNSGAQVRLATSAARLTTITTLSQALLNAGCRLVARASARMKLMVPKAPTELKWPSVEAGR